MTTNSHELTGRVERYARHVAALAAGFQVHIGYTKRPEDAGAGTVLADDHLPFDARRRMISVAPVIDETTYAVALHELGHVCSGMGMIVQSEGSATMRRTHQVATLRDMRLKLHEEEAAWEWAHHYALEWTPAMQAVEDWALGTYKKRAKQLGLKP